MGGEDLFGQRLKVRVEQILADNQSTLAVASKLLREILTDLQNFVQSLAHLVDAFKAFHIGSETLSPGEVEVAVLIPRDAVHDRLMDFSAELADTEFILSTFSELATGYPDDLKIRTVSSSNLMLFLVGTYLCGEAFARAIDFVVSTYKKILEIRKLSAEIERLQLPPDISKKTTEYANGYMEEAIERFVVEITQRYSRKASDGGRRNELSNKVKISLSRMANRIDRSFNFEVRIEPPTSPDAETDEEVKQAVQTIEAASVNMQYIKLEGPPILALPEGKDGSDKAAAKGDESKQKKKT